MLWLDVLLVWFLFEVCFCCQFFIFPLCSYTVPDCNLLFRWVFIFIFQEPFGAQLCSAFVLCLDVPVPCGSRSIRLKQFEYKQKAPRGWEFFLGLVDPSRNRLASTAYFTKPGFSVLVKSSFSQIDLVEFSGSRFHHRFWKQVHMHGIIKDT